MTYEEATDYLENLGKKGIKPGLDNIRSLCGALGNPESRLRFIQIAGTNGKGSTSIFISEILRAAGYRTGIYSSPAVFSPLEIIKYNGRNISKGDYCRIISDIASENVFGCTRFEVETVLAFSYFAEKECDYVILEAGMGGLLDATNVVENTVMSVITAVGMDHMQFLGNTLKDIAVNKAGIIKNNSKVVYINSKDDAERVILNTASERNSEARFTDVSLAKKIKYSATATSFSYKGFDAKIKMSGTYQVNNACMAIEAAKWLNETGLNISDKAITAGLLKAENHGRFEIISTKPLTVLDGAHNVPAAVVLKESLQTYFTKKKYIYIMGMFRDKDTQDVIDILAPMASHIITVTLPNKERSLSSYELAGEVSRVNPMVTSADSIFEACELAGLMADKDTCIVALGSLSHLSAVKDYFLRIQPKGKETKV